MLEAILRQKEVEDRTADKIESLINAMMGNKAKSFINDMIDREAEDESEGEDESDPQKLRWKIVRRVTVEVMMIVKEQVQDMRESIGKLRNHSQKLEDHSKKLKDPSQNIDPEQVWVLVDQSLVLLKKAQVSMHPNWAWSEKAKVAAREVSGLITNEMRESTNLAIKIRVDEILDRANQMLNYVDEIQKSNMEDPFLARLAMFCFREIMTEAAEAKDEAEVLVTDRKTPLWQWINLQIWTELQPSPGTETDPMLETIMRQLKEENKMVNKMTSLANAMRVYFIDIDENNPVEAKIRTIIRDQSQDMFEFVRELDDHFQELDDHSQNIDPEQVQFLVDQSLVLLGQARALMNPNRAWGEEVKVAIGEVSGLITREMRESTDEAIKTKVDKILDGINQMLDYADKIQKSNMENSLLARFAMLYFKTIMFKAAVAKAEAEKLAAGTNLQTPSSS
jgi:hypothetical protein